MRNVIVAGNWKMNTSPGEASGLARDLAARTRVDGVVRIFCPPFVSLDLVRNAVASPAAASPDGTGVWVGAQNVHHELGGAHTGEIAASMLVDLATWVIVGHSERRRDAGETDEQIAAKLANAWGAGIRPILCVGEVLEDREAGRADAVVERQVRGALAGASVPPWDSNADAELPWLTIAYEPVWAIGTGRNARGADAAAMADVIRRVLDDLGIAGEAVPILYGGSVTSANIAEFLAEPSIDGALVGGASLKVDEMAGIVARAGLTAAARAGQAGAPAQSTTGSDPSHGS